jgi:predicted O-methyltransferase YrrM
MTPGLSTKIRWATRMYGYLFWVAIGHPSVLWHYLAGSTRYLLIKFGIPSGPAQHVAAVRKEFETYAARGQFKERWFDGNIVPWSATFRPIFDRSDPVRMLEIGSWEGRSSLFLLTYFTKGHLTAVDTWSGGDEYEYNATRDLQDLESRFDGNVAPGANRVTKRKGLSLQVLPQLLDEQQRFDVIYVDGSHFSDDVLMDAIVAWRLLNQGGVVMFDDVLSPFYTRARANTAWALKTFMKYHAGEFKLLSAGYQLILQKSVTFTDEVASEVGALAGFQYDEAHS